MNTANSYNFPGFSLVGRIKHVYAQAKPYLRTLAVTSLVVLSSLFLQNEPVKAAEENYTPVIVQADAGEHNLGEIVLVQQQGDGCSEHSEQGWRDSGTNPGEYCFRTVDGKVEYCALDSEKATETHPECPWLLSSEETPVPADLPLIIIPSDCLSLEGTCYDANAVNEHGGLGDCIAVDSRLNDLGLLESNEDGYCIEALVQPTAVSTPVNTPTPDDQSPTENQGFSMACATTPLILGGIVGLLYLPKIVNSIRIFMISRMTDTQLAVRANRNYWRGKAGDVNEVARGLMQKNPGMEWSHARRQASDIVRHGRDWNEGSQSQVGHNEGG
ncbi:hypothetical protein JXB41_08755 [Candidatus Woesearchaeota archaeon]|nr:hypothetical protein [Candidatus Woesearchaeota archaeon]